MTAGLGPLQSSVGDSNDPYLLAKVLGWSYDIFAVSGGNIWTLGEVTVCKIPLTRPSSLISTLTASISVGGTTLTAGQNFLGLYSVNQATGLCTLVGTSPDQSVPWASAGQKDAAISPVTLAGGPGVYCYGALLTNAVAAPTFYRGSPGVSLTGANPGIFLTNPDGLRIARAAVGAIALPASFTLASLTASSLGVIPWIALS